MPRSKSLKSKVKGVGHRNDTGKWFYRSRGRNKIYKEFDTKQEAETFAYQMNANNNLGIVIRVDEGLLLSDAIKRYISQVPESNQCKQHTVNDYKAFARNHIIPYFKGRTASSITKNDIEEFKVYLSKKDKINSPKNKRKKLSSRTINEVLRLLNAIFEHSIAGGYIPENPMLRVSKLPNRSIPREVLTLEEAQKLLKVAENEISVTKYGVVQGEYYLLILFSLISGAREGEVSALTWDDINLDDGYVQINKSYSHNTLGTPKTRHSNRIVQIPKFLCVKLIEHKTNQKSNTKNLIFPNRAGNYMNPSNLNNRVLQRLLQKANITKHIVWHSLRHTGSTILVELGVKANAIQYQYGHSDIRTTLSTYTHTTATMVNEMMDALEVFNL